MGHRNGTGVACVAAVLDKEGPVQVFQWCKGPAAELRPEPDPRGVVLAAPAMSL